jgi:predicted DNA-binding transcriptional regulator AlpA
MDHPREDRRVRVPEAARYLGLSPSTLAKMRLRGDGPVFLKLNRAVAYDSRDLDEWLAHRRRASTSGSGTAT